MGGGVVFNLPTCSLKTLGLELIYVSAYELLIQVADKSLRKAVEERIKELNSILVVGTFNLFSWY